MTDLSAYLTDIELALIRSPTIATYQIVRSEINTDAGYIRLRATFVNGDFLEAAEYFILEHSAILTDDYRYQWMDGGQTRLHRRWDNTPHFPELPGFDSLPLKCWCILRWSVVL